MFPTCGFFSSVPCQYYINGLCERPYCHFKHPKQHELERLRAKVKENSSTLFTVGDAADSPTSDDGSQQSSGSDPQSAAASGKGHNSELANIASTHSPGSVHDSSAGSFSIPSFTDNSSKYEVPVAEEPELYLTALEDDKDNVLEPSPYPTKDVSAVSALPAYLPTPKTPSLPIPEPETDDLGVPVYQPTPKRELKRRYKDQAKVKKGKSTDLEYDPECNYSCQGLVGRSQEKRRLESDDLVIDYEPIDRRLESDDLVIDYEPIEKKACVSELRVVKQDRKRQSCESLVASSPGAQDEEMPEGEFSEQEEDSNRKIGPVPEEGVKTNSNDEKLDSFENIGDDDISSDDDFIDVPSVAVDYSNFKQQQQLVKTMDKKTSGSKPGSTKSISSEKLGKTGEASHKQTGKKSNHTSSKHSGHDKLSKSSSHKKLEQTDKLSSQKTDKLSSQKKESQQSSLGVLKKSSSASAKGQSTEKGHSSKKIHSSQKSECSTYDKQKHTNHLERPSSNHKSLSKASSIGKLDISDKHSTSSSKKKKSFESKMPAFSSVSPISSDRRPSLDGKSKDTSHRRSSLESKTSKVIAGKSSDQADDNRKNHSSNRQSSFESKASRDHGGKSTDREQAAVENRSLSSVGVKSSHSDMRSDTEMKQVKHSSSVNKTPCDRLLNSERQKLALGERRTSTGSRPSTPNSSSGIKKPREQRHHASSPSKSKTSFSSKGVSKDTLAYGEKPHLSSKSKKEYKSSHLQSGKEHKSSHSESGKISSSKHLSSGKVSNSSSQDKREKHRDSKLDSDRGYDRKAMKRMNSRLFGEDSDDDVALEDVGNLGDAASDLSDSGRVFVEEDRIDFGYIHDSDLEEEDIFDECLRIFKETPLPKKTESQPEKKLIKDQKKEDSGISSAVLSVPGKKRVAHRAPDEMPRPALVRKDKPRLVLSAQEQMHNRILLMHQRAQERAAQQAVQEQEVSSTSGSAANVRPEGLNLGEKKRIAHVPKDNSASTAKATSSAGEKKITVATTASKTEKRVAHTPNVSNLKRPMIPTSFGSKVPTNVRQRYLNIFIDECLKFCSSEKEAFKKGLEEESGVYERSSSQNIYLRVAVNAISRLRTEAKETMPGTSAPKQRQVSGPSQSHEATLGGARATKINFTLHRPSTVAKKEAALTEVELYQKLWKYRMMEEQLEENGYPRPSPEAPGRAIMKGKAYQDTDTLLKDNERTCARCGKRFMVHSDGSYINEDECVYHWTRAYPRKKSGFFQHIYNCCNSDTSSKGCQVAANHVHERNKQDKLVGFMQTIARPAPKDGNYGIYALDCEMVYTLGGLELARVTVVNTEGESVYETLVKPFNPIIDYNTRFSGLTAADLADVHTTLTEVQAVLLSLFSDKTILIGHSLESDFFALKLIHSTVVDTSVVFPHRLGPPFKRALKNLMLDIFQKIIQCDDGGHDSKEDAVACLQLMKWRIKEDSKRENRYSKD